MTVVYAPRALRDIDDILAYIHGRNPRGAKSVSYAIEHTVQVCAANPRLGNKTDEPGLMRCALGKYRYAIFYRRLKDGEGIEVVRVIHGARIRNLDQLPLDE